MNSTLFSSDKLEPHYYFLEPNDSYTVIYKLTDLVGLVFKGNILKKGTYEIQLNYYNVISNKVILEIE